MEDTSWQHTLEAKALSKAKLEIRDRSQLPDLGNWGQVTEGNWDQIIFSHLRKFRSGPFFSIWEI